MTYMLDRCEGPACPRCGCQDAEILAKPNPGQGAWYGAGRARCKHCQLIYHFKEIVTPAASGADLQQEPVRKDPVREIPIVMCEQCKTEMKVAKTEGKVRRYRCAGCGRTAKRARADADVA